MNWTLAQGGIAGTELMRLENALQNHSSTPSVDAPDRRGARGLGAERGRRPSGGAPRVRGVPAVDLFSNARGKLGVDENTAVSHRAPSRIGARPLERAFMKKRSILVVASVALAACATLRGDETVCPEYRDLRCATAAECSIDAARGCRVCQCSPPPGAVEGGAKLRSGVPPDRRAE